MSKNNFGLKLLLLLLLLLGTVVARRLKDQVPAAEPDIIYKVGLRKKKKRKKNGDCLP